MARVAGWTREQLQLALRFSRITREEYDRLMHELERKERARELSVRERVRVLAAYLKPKDHTT